MNNKKIAYVNFCKEESFPDLPVLTFLITENE